jgi:hypothetical protein
MSEQKISGGSPSVTSSLGSESGPTSCDSRGGPTIGQSGRGLAPASRSASPVDAGEPPTSATSGPTGSGSSASADLQRSLASRLRVRLPSGGLTLYRLTWKERDTPSGRQICALRASALRTSGSDCIGWPSPAVTNASRGGQASRTSGVRRNLQDFVMIVGWATPVSREAGGTPEQFLAKKEKAKANGAQLGVSLTSLSLQVQTVVGWQTPTVQDSNGRTHHNQRDGGVILSLLGQSRLVGWPTSMAGSPATENYNEAGDSCNSRKTRLLVSGEDPTGSDAPTAKRGQLNPAFSRWLMGLPLEWDVCAPTVTRSSRRSP